MLSIQDLIFSGQLIFWTVRLKKMEKKMCGGSVTPCALRWKFVTLN